MLHILVKKDIPDNRNIMGGYYEKAKGERKSGGALVRTMEGISAQQEERQMFENSKRFRRL